MLVIMKRKEKIHRQNFFLNKTKTTAALQKGRTERNQSVVNFFQTKYIKNIKSLHSNLLNRKKAPNQWKTKRNKWLRGF